MKWLYVGLIDRSRWEIIWLLSCELNQEQVHSNQPFHRSKSKSIVIQLAARGPVGGFLYHSVAKFCQWKHNLHKVDFPSLTHLIHTVPINRLEQPTKLPCLLARPRGKVWNNGVKEGIASLLLRTRRASHKMERRETSSRAEWICASFDLSLKDGSL